MKGGNEFNRCWQCHEYAPGGVCMREHPDFNWLKARGAGNVSGGWVFRTEHREIPSTPAPEPEPSVESVPEAVDYVAVCQEIVKYRADRRRRPPRFNYCPECGRMLTKDPAGDWCESCEFVLEVAR